MNLSLNCGELESYLVGGIGVSLMGGVHYLFRFENGYGASVIKTSYSYGHERDLWELAVVKFDDKCRRNFEVCYDTPITEDVEGCLTDKEVRKLLRRIKEL